MQYYYFGTEQHCDDSHYNYIWLPNQGEFKQFDEQHIDKLTGVKDHLSFIGTVPNNFIVEKYLAEPMVFTSPIVAAKWILQTIHVPPLYDRFPVLSYSFIDHFNKISGGVAINICKETFPWTGMELYPFSNEDDVLVISLIDIDGNAVVTDDPPIEFRHTYRVPSIAKDTLIDLRRYADIRIIPTKMTRL